VAKDKAKAILSYATPNPVGPYRLVTPPTPVGPSQTKTPVLPVVGGSLVNVPLPQMPSRTSNAPSQDVGQRRQVNVPKLPMAEKVRSDVIKDLDDLLANAGEEQPEYTRVYGPKRFGLDRYNEDLLSNSAVKRRLDSAAEKFAKDAKLQARFNELRDAAASYEQRPYTPGGSDQAKRIAALNIYREVSAMRESHIPIEAIPDLISLRDRVDLLDPYKGNYTQQRETFTRRYVKDGIITDSYLYQIIGNDLRELDKAGRETYFALLPGWTGTHKELRDAAASLSK
jgi:hypothetical protein